MDEKQINLKIEQGWIRAKVIFEIVGNPKEHIVKSLEKYVTTLKQNKGIEVIAEEIAEPEQKEGVWSTFAELELLVEGLEKFVYLSITFTPASIEILAPEELTFSDKNLTDWLNELLSLLHEIGVKVKQYNQENVLLKKSLNNLMNNIIVLGLDTPRTRKALADHIGTEETMLEPFLQTLLKRGRIVKKGDIYQKHG